MPTFSHALGPTTYFRDVWPDSSWTIKDIGQDKCAASTAGGSAPHASVFAFKSDQFGCGVGADALPICGRSGNVVTCMTDYKRKVAVRFTTAAPATTFPLPSPQMPLMVKLENGATCTYVDHDTAQHYKGLTSNLACHDWWGQGGSALLPIADGGYFYPDSPTWSVDYGVGTNPPVQEMAIDEIVYARQQ